MLDRPRLYVVVAMVLLLGLALTSAMVWTRGAFTHGLPDYGAGCYCHNNNISVYINGSGDGMFAVTFGPFPIGSSFHIKASTSDAHTTGAVPNNQFWMSTQGDNSKFNIQPSGVTDNSASDLNQTAGNITAIYMATAPTTAGSYLLVLYAQGVLVSPVTILVVASNSSVRQTATRIATSSSTLSSNVAGTSTTAGLTTSSLASSTTSTTTLLRSNSSSSEGGTSTGNGGGGIPEFPYQLLAFPIFTILLVACYLWVRRHGLGEESAGRLRRRPTNG